MTLGIKGRIERLGRPRTRVVALGGLLAAGAIGFAVLLTNAAAPAPAVESAAAPAAAGAPGEWSAEFSRDGSAIVRYDGSRVLSFKYVAWGPAWKFVDFKPVLTRGLAGAFAINGDIPAMGTTVEGTAGFSDHALTFDYTLRTAKPSNGNVGGAISLTTRLSSDVFDTKAIGKPALGPDGLTWTPVPGQTLTVRFDGLARPPGFEPGRQDEVRAWFIPGDLDVGTKTVKMTITLPPGATFRGVPASRYPATDEKTWLPKTLDWTTSPVDLSYLNDKPAGGHGFVKAQGDQFVFADGTPAKFWGCNVQAYALFDAKNAAIEQQAKRIAALGYNLVRIHHHDSADWVTPNVFVKDAPDTQRLDAAALDRIDYWVKCLRDNGVYVWIDLHVGRPFRPGDDIPAFDELTPATGSRTPNRQAKGLNYVDARVTELMKQFAKTYLTRKNKYTGTAYVDEPAMMGVLITNENDITDHFGVSFLPDKNKPVHAAAYNKLRDAIVSNLGLNKSQAAQSWLAGPSKVVLNQVQYDWSKDFVDYLHSIGVKCPIATTNTWGSDPLFSLPALTAGDMIDVHSYGQSESFGSNPRHDDSSALWIAAAQVQGKPLTITEWNTPYPQRDRFTQPLYIAAMAAFQGWDAPMIFGYQQSPLTPPTRLSDWTTSNDPAVTALMPAAALLYRRGDVSPAKETVTLALPAETMMYQAISPASSRMLRTTAERHKLQIAMPATPLMPWLTPTKPEGQVVTDPAFDALPEGATSTTSDTGELSRAWKDGVFTIDTPRTQAAVGWIGGREMTLGDVTIKVATPKAAVVVSSMDGLPLATSKKMLLTVAAQIGERKTLGDLAEPVVGTLKFKAAVAAAAALTPQGKAGKPLTVGDDGVTLDGLAATHWFVLTRP